ncbi:MAG: hypothetical protein QNK37_03325 [Acidobacteriota bacterium]|nr:hypothetical protein [Acidobacteriota bacterium]
MFRKSLSYLYPLELVTALDIARRIYPARHQLAQRNQVARHLAKLERGLPPLGDYNGKVLAYRYMAEVATGYLSRPTFPFPLSTPEMITAFPDLTSKLLSLPPIIVQPKDLHPFLAALHHWSLDPLTRKTKLYRVYLPQPWEQTMGGVLR